MNRYAVVKNGIVDIVTESDSALESNWVAIASNSTVWTGWTYANGKFTAPVVPVVPLSAAENNAVIILKIAALESGQLRGMREYMLTGSKAGLQLVEDRIADLRAKLEN